MYAISNSYRNAIKSNIRKTYIKGTITTSSNKEIEINDEILQKGSLYVTNQCVNSDNFEYGAVFSAECGFTFKTDVDRYSLYNSKIELTETRELLDGSLEDVKIGTFYTNEVKRNGSKISITAYDSMVDLNIDIAEDTNGTAYDLLSLIEEKTGIELAQTLNEIEALPNATRELTVKTERVGTYRDLLSSICKLTCTFGYITRDNKLKLQSYSNKEDIDIDNLQRKSISVVDYETYFNSVKASFVAQENYYPYEVTSDNAEISNGLQLDLGEIPIFQGLVEVKYDVLNEILVELLKVKYVPCEVQMINSCFFDLGDMINFTNINNDENVSVNSLITYHKWVFHGIDTIKSAGGNPKLNSAKSKTDKQISSAINNMPDNNVVVYSYTNSKEYNIRYSETEIIKFQFSTVGEANPIFLASVNFSMDKDGEVNFKFYEDNVLRDDLIFCKYLERGNHFVTLFMNAKDETGTRNEITVKASCKYFASDTRTMMAKLNSLTSILKPVKYNTKYTLSSTTTSFILPTNYSENSILNVYVNNVRTDYTINDGYIVLSATNISDVVDIEVINLETTDYIPTLNEEIPLMNIKPSNIHAVVYSQGLSASESTWDGTYSVEENVNGLLTMSNFEISSFSASVNEVIQ